MRLSTRRAVVVIALVLAVAATGCEFSNSNRRKAEAATAADISALRQEIGRLRQDVDALENELSRTDRALRNELAAVRRAIDDLDSKSADQVAAATRELADKINEIERKRVSDKNALNKKMDAIVAEVQRVLGTATSTTSTTRAVSGFKYTVQEGDTVSGIAAKYRDKYGTTTKAILEANGLDANSTIFPGDTLIIPVEE
jgi:nucleoid-associated protein YgaU